MKSQSRMSAYSAWKLQLGLLPQGVFTFVVTLVGVVLGMSLAIVGIGIPILAGTLSWSAARMEREKLRWDAWREGRPIPEVHAASPSPQAAGNEVAPRSSWQSWFRTLGNPMGYRAAAHHLLGFPIRLALFVVTLTIPLSVFAVMLAPAVYKVSDYLYGYVLYNDSVMEMLLPPLTPFQRSIAVAGVGVVLMLFVPALLRACGSLYAGWLAFFAGPSERATHTPVEVSMPQTAAPAAAAAGDWLARAEAAISRYDEDAHKIQQPQAH